MFFGALHEARNLLLNLLETAVRTAATGLGLEFALFNNFGAKTLGSALDSFGKQLVFRLRSGNQQPVGPLFPNQILPNRVGLHGARRRNVHDVGAAIFFSHRVVRRTDVENQRAFAFKCIRQL